MASSGTVTYRANALTLCKAAVRLVGGYDSEGGSLSTQQTTDALEALNMLIKAWEANGLQLWERKYGVVFPQKDQGVYVLGGPGPGGDHACLSSPMNSGFILTTLSTTAASGATSIVLTSATGQLNTVGNTGFTITSGDYVGVQLDSGATYWTTASATPASTTVALAVGLTGAAASGNVVYVYRTKMVRPLRILDSFVRNAVQGNDSPCRIISREEYSQYGMKTSSGSPTQFYYDPQVNTGNLYAYPVPSLATQLMFIEFQRPIEDFVTSADDFDMPQEWADALKFNLARRIAPEYEVSTYKYSQIKELAQETFALLDTWDQEAASVYLQPESM